MTFFIEPDFKHGQPARTGILYCNLGTPEAPTAPAVRRYLAEFLSDQRVVEIPKAIWWLILYGIILRVRPAKSAAKYATIWTREGSPLKIWTQTQALMLHGWLGERGHQITARFAMRYGSPSIAGELDRFKAEGITRVLIVPAYPQYSATTTASVFDAVYAWAAQTRLLPEFRFINHYHDHPLYITALASRVTGYWQTHGRPDHFVMSFHGVPHRTLELGDPYHCECRKTARLLAEVLGLDKASYSITFQSRFGRAKWLEPYTEPTLIGLGKAGVKRVDVFCPGFTGDCLETLEEIAQEVKAAFMAAGGQEFHYIPALNDSQAWLTALRDICETHMAGWPTRVTPDADAMLRSQQAARALGATQ